jgi:hypothetical protein
MKPNYTLRDRIRYAVDNTFTRGTAALILWLAILSVAIIVVTALVVTWLRITPDGEAPLGFWEAAWRNLMRTLDAGTMGGDAGWGYRIIMLLVTLGGVFVISTLIGVLSSAIEGKLDELRRGKSKILETNHIVILGWSEQIYTIISELVEANRNQPANCIAVLSPLDKVVMDEMLVTRLKDTGRTRLVSRCGSPIDINDLNIVSIDNAKSIIILAPEDTDNPDAEVIKVLLAIVNNASRKKSAYHIVAELRNPDNAQVARIVGKDEVELVLTGDVIARILAQTCRQSGLSAVYTELLDFGGDEIYLRKFPQLEGMLYRDTLMRFESNAVMGIARSDGIVQLNPDPATKIGKEDQLVLVAADDDQIFLTDNATPQLTLISFGKEESVREERVLLLGWNRRAPRIIRELDRYAGPNSKMVLMSRMDHPASYMEQLRGLQNFHVDCLTGDITDRKQIAELDLGSFAHIIVLSNSDDLTAQKADSRTMMTLLHLRDLAEKAGFGYSIVSEMQDIRNRNLIEVAHADDFIVSDKLISLLLAQVSENKTLNKVFEDVFDPDGSEIYLKPVEHYITVDQPVNFYTVVESASRRGETAIGYRKSSESRDQTLAYGIHLNPRKSQETAYSHGDRIIVLAEK